MTPQESHINFSFSGHSKVFSKITQVIIKIPLPPLVSLLPFLKLGEYLVNIYEIFTSSSANNC